MNTRNIVLLAAVFIFLVLALWYQKTAQGPQDLLTMDNLHSFIPPDLDLQSVNALELTRPEHPLIRLEKKDDQWVLPQWGHVPANTHKIQTLLQALTDLRGELRSTDPDIIADYQLETQEALAISLLSPTKEPLRLLLGKGDLRTLFVRLDNSTAVYSTPGIILGYLGAHGPRWSAQFWLETTLISMSMAQTQEIQLTMPEIQGILKRSQEPEDNNTHEDHWLFTQHQGTGLSREQMQTILMTLDHVSIFEVLPPDSPLKAALEEPTHELKIITQDQTLVLEAVQETISPLIRVQGSEHIYRIEKNIFQRLFPDQQDLD